MTLGEPPLPMFKAFENESSKLLLLKEFAEVPEALPEVLVAIGEKNALSPELD